MNRQISHIFVINLKKSFKGFPAIYKTNEIHKVVVEEGFDNKEIKKLNELLGHCQYPTIIIAKGYTIEDIEKCMVSFCETFKDDVVYFNSIDSSSYLLVVPKVIFERIGLFDPDFKTEYIYDFLKKVQFYFSTDKMIYADTNKRSHAKKDLFLYKNDSRLAVKINSNSDIRNGVKTGEYNKTVTFIILSYNKPKQTLECIQAIENTVHMPYDIVLLDNHSNVDTVRFIKQNVANRANIKVIYSDRNLGPAAGRKKAIEYATGEYFVFFDNDIVAQENWLPELFVRMESNTKVAAVSCKVLFPDDTVQFNALKTYVESPYIKFELIGFMQKKTNLQTCCYLKNDWIPAGATLYRADVFKQLEGLELYPNTYEDNEAGIQTRALGYELLNSPASIVIHKHYNYVDTNSINKEYLSARYNEGNLITASIIFYKRNNLIVKDESIFKIMGIYGKNVEEVVAEFERRKNLPKVSIIVPVYNVADYLEVCLNSLCNQTLKDIEIICVNDGSTDNSLSIIQKYQERDKRIVVIDKENTGYGHSMNIGIAKATGEYIGIIESDDWAEENMFQKLYEAAKHHNAEVVKSNYNQYYTKPVEKKYFLEALHECSYNKIIDPYENQQIFLAHSAIWSAIYKRDFLLQNHITFLQTPGASYQDTSFAFKVWACAHKVYLLREAFLNYRCDNESSSVASGEKIFCVCTEIAEIERFLTDMEIQGYNAAAQRVRFAVYLWNYNRLPLEYKYAFLLKAAEEFRNVLHQGKLKKEDWDLPRWNTIQSWMFDLDRYYQETIEPLHHEINGKEEILKGKTQNLCLLKGIIESVRSCDNIAIYGAGVYGKNFYKYLQMQGMENRIKCFFVTNVDDNENTVYGRPIYSIHEIRKYDSNILVIVAIREINHVTVNDHLKKYGVDEKIFLNDSMNHIIKYIISGGSVAV